MVKDDIAHLKVLKNWHLDFSLFEKISCPIPWDLANAVPTHSRWPKQIDIKIEFTVRYTRQITDLIFLPSLFSLIFLSKCIGLYALSRPR